MENSKILEVLQDFDVDIALEVLDEVGGDYKVEDVRTFLKEKFDPSWDEQEERLKQISEEQIEALAFACRERLFAEGPGVDKGEMEWDISGWNKIVLFQDYACSRSILYKGPVLFRVYYE